MIKIIVGIATAVIVIKYIYKVWKFNQIKIQNLELHPFIIDLFYPAVKLALMSPEERFQTVYEYFNNYQNNVKMLLGTKCLIIITNVDYVQKILFSPKCLDKPRFIYNLMERGSGLIAASSKKNWREQRKLFNHSFGGKNLLQNFYQVFVDQSDVLCEELSENANNLKEFDFLHYAKQNHFKVLCTTMLGISNKDFEDNNNYDDVYKAFEV